VRSAIIGDAVVYIHGLSHMRSESIATKWLLLLAELPSLVD
jgi:hypothetical protein